MTEVLSMIGLFAVVFGTSLALTYLFTHLRANKRENVSLPEGAKVRMVGAGGSYRCYFARSEPKGLVFSAPLQRDRYVPLRVGDSLIVQAPFEGGLLTFSGEIIERSAEAHEIMVAHPKIVRRMDRRSEARDTTCRGSEALLNGMAAKMVDLSAGGARVLAGGTVKPGEIVTLELPLGLGAVPGWALESLPAAWMDRQGSEIRIQFQQPLVGLAVKPTRA